MVDLLRTPVTILCAAEALLYWNILSGWSFMRLTFCSSSSNSSDLNFESTTSLVEAMVNSQCTLSDGSDSQEFVLSAFQSSHILLFLPAVMAHFMGTLNSRMVVWILMMACWLLLVVSDMFPIFLVRVILNAASTCGSFLFLNALVALKSGSDISFLQLGILCGAFDSGRISALLFSAMTYAVIPLPYAIGCILLICLLLGTLNQTCLYHRRNSSHLAHLSRQWNTIINRTTPLSRTDQVAHWIVYGICFLFFIYFERSFPTTLKRLSPEGIIDPLLLSLNYLINCCGLLIAPGIGYILGRHFNSVHDSSLAVLHILSLCLSVLSAMISLVPNIYLQTVVVVFVLLARNSCFMYIVHFTLSRYAPFFPAGGIMFAVISAWSVLCWPLEIVINTVTHDNTFYINVGFALVLTMCLCHPILIAGSITTPSGSTARAPPGTNLLRKMSTAPMVPKIMVTDDTAFEDSDGHCDGTDRDRRVTWANEATPGH